MSFFGGGTDMESFFRENGGAVLSTTFDKYCYVNVRHLPRFFDYSTELSYSKTERVTCIEDIQHPAIRNAMKMLDIYAGTYFRFGINPALWNKLFRRDKLLRYYLDIPKQLTLGEDFAVSIPFMACAECISVIDSDAYYHYRQRENSMVRAYDPKLNQKVGCLVDYLRQQENLKLFDTQLNYYYSWLYMSCMKNDAAIKCKFFDMAKALEKTSNLFNEIVRLDDLRELTFKYSMIFTLIKYKHWKMLALLFQIKKAAR